MGYAYWKLGLLVPVGPAGKRQTRSWSAGTPEEDVVVVEEENGVQLAVENDEENEDEEDEDEDQEEELQVED